jgi:hypothetical protein
VLHAVHGCHALMVIIMIACPPQVDHHKEVEAWKVAMCLMHPMDPTCGRSPSSLVTTCTIRPLVMLADKYNLAVSASRPAQPAAEAPSANSDWHILLTSDA